VLDHRQAEFIARSKCVNCESRNFAEIARGNYGEEPLYGYLHDDPGGPEMLKHLKSAKWSLCKCGDCSQIFHRLILNDEWNERRFSEWMSSDAIQEFEARLGNHSKRAFDAATSYVSHVLRIERLTRHLRAKGEPVRLLDFGCGWGKFLSMAKSFGFEALGVDRAIPRIEGAAVRVFRSIDELPAGQASFHAVTLFEVLEHVDEPSAVLRRLASLVHPGGLMVLETPDCSGVTGISSKRDYYKVHPLEHINGFTHETLTSIAVRAGFAPISRGPAFVSADFARVAKRVAKHLLARDGRSTQLYFRRLGDDLGSVAGLVEPTGST